MEDNGEALAIDSRKRTDAEIYSDHAVALVQFATVLVGPADAQDVVSSAVLRSLGNPGWSQVQNHRSYLHQAVANEARNLYRSESRRRRREVRMSEPVLIYLPELRPDVQRAVEKLSVRQRAVVYLTYWEDMTDQMAADYLGISAGSVRRHLARARDHLRKALYD
ncbi:MAG: RNA polymerase sigma factor [Acidimicrobiia bacterium]